MTSVRSHSGGCQCGAVRYRAERLNDDAHICHCRMCQKAVGGPFIALVSVANADLVWTRGKAAEFLSSENTARGFCARCGTPLYMRDLDDDEVYLTLGALDDPDRVPPRRQVGTESRRVWFSDLCELPGSSTTEEAAPETAARIAASNHQHPDHDTTDWPKDATP